MEWQKDVRMGDTCPFVSWEAKIKGYSLLVNTLSIELFSIYIDASSFLTFPQYFNSTSAVINKTAYREGSHTCGVSQCHSAMPAPFCSDSGVPGRWATISFSIITRPQSTSPRRPDEGRRRANQWRLWNKEFFEWGFRFFGVFRKDLSWARRSRSVVRQRAS